jgi:hypothetical protein
MAMSRIVLYFGDNLQEDFFNIEDYLKKLELFDEVLRVCLG